MTELVWDGKYDKDGKRVAPVRVALPFQTIETVNESAEDRLRTRSLFAQGQPTEWRNRLIWGDKKYVLPSLLPEFAGKVDLIYIDPPFNVGADFSFTATVPDYPDTDENETASFLREPSIIEQKAYRDTWGEGLDSYLHWFYETAVLLREVLTDDGSLYVHLDHHVSHYAKVVLDDVLGPGRFRNEVVWRRTASHSDAATYGTVHDVILFYTADENGRVAEVYQPYDPQYVEQYYRYKDEDGRRFMSDNLTGAGPGPARRFADRMLSPPSGRHWLYDQKGIDRVLAENRIFWTRNGVPRLKRYLEETAGMRATDVWDDIQPVRSWHTDQAQSYPTQKPEALLERIIKASSNEGDLVLDCFCLRRGSRVLVRRDPHLASPVYVGGTGHGATSLPVHGEGQGGVSVAEPGPSSLICIEDIQVGDWVLGHDGDWHRVLRVHTRAYRGPLYGIRVSGNGETLWSTPDHRHLAGKRPVRFPRPADSPSRWAHVPPEAFARSRELRHNATDAERRLWSRLRNEQLGVSFRRQHPIGPFISDFYCKDARLVVELDGGQHATPDGTASDVRRTDWLESIGLAVMRFWNPDVLKDLDGVIDAIRERLAIACPIPGMDVEWRQTKEISVGDVLYRADPDGAPQLTPTEVLSVETTEVLEEVFDLTVEGSHSYLTSVCFVHNCGSGTTAAVAEKLGRRWIACDLSRFAIHTTRKRLLGIEGVKPFVVQNLGKYERQAWQKAEFADAEGRAALEETYRRFVLGLYHAEPVSGFTWLHGVRGGRMVHVGGVDTPVSYGDVQGIIRELWQAAGKSQEITTNGVDVLGWEFAFDLNETTRQLAAQHKIDLQFKQIPREVMDKKAVDAGDIQFFELGALDVAAEVDKLEVTLTLKDFIIPPDELPDDVRHAIKHWSQWIDYWAVDWNYRDDTFHNEWQAYRTKKDPKITLSTRRRYDEAGSYVVVVKVIDILGNDTTKALSVKVG